MTKTKTYIALYQDIPTYQNIKITKIHVCSHQSANFRKTHNCSVLHEVHFNFIWGIFNYQVNDKLNSNIPRIFMCQGS